jgi:hypothetical protein
VARRLVAILVAGLSALVVAAFLTIPPRSAGALAGDPSVQATGPRDATPPPGLGQFGPGSDGAGDGGGMTPGGSPSVEPRSDPPIALGAFIPGAASDPAGLDAYAHLVGAMPRIVMWYQSWVAPWNDFNTRAADAARTRGATPMVSWEPSAKVTNDPTWALRTIADGSHDAYIKTWASEVAAWGHELYVRPMYEMNGWWAPWCAEVNGNSAAEFVTAWRHIVDLARGAGATNIRWVWSPNVDSDGLGVPFAALYPGDGYVDWVGLDGFNRGTSWPTTHWVGIQRIFAGSIQRLREITTKPLMIAETGSTEAGGDKAAWIRGGLGAVPELLPGVRAVIWFDKLETAVGIDWRVNSSAASLEAFRDVAMSAAFSGRLP